MENWHIDKKYFEESINKGYKLLKRNDLDKDYKRIINSEIKVFKKYLNNQFDYNDSSEMNYEKYDNNISIELNDKIKNNALNKMKKQYKILGDNLIEYFKLLLKSNILEEKMGEDKTFVDINTQYEYTLENYKRHSNLLYQALINNMNKKDNILVESDNSLQYSSYCYYSHINDSQILVINPSDNCYNLNHELEHALENILGFNSGNYFQELGAISFEMLFLDLVYNINSYINSGDYEDRIFDMYWYLDELVRYFSLMQEFKKRDFNVSLSDFTKLIMEKMDILDDEVLSFVLEEILGDGKDASMLYLFSYLQAIKIRKFHYISNIDILDLIKNYLLTNKYYFNDINDFKIYDEYFNTMNKRIRNK